MLSEKQGWKHGMGDRGGGSGSGQNYLNEKKLTTFFAFQGRRAADYAQEHLCEHLAKHPQLFDEPKKASNLCPARLPASSQC